METNADQTGYKKAGRLLQDGAALIPIDDYAAREGVSAELIEACGQAGIVQIRRHKGKIFIVDIPLTPYFQEAKETDSSQQGVSRMAKTTVMADTSNTGENKSPKASNQTIPAGSIANLARKMFLKACRLTGKLHEPAERIIEKQIR